ncbi:MAG: ribosome-associated translation inhibitor RaiA [Candidatus Pacebacteria bacterium]|nr:ribosome-associated translation inhibitor RaiA [Candidatus Paceibacterota bacterium]
MNITVQSKTLEVTDALRAFCEKQASKVGRFGRNISQINIHIENITRKKNDPTAASVQYSVDLPGKVLVVKRTAVNMYDAVVDATNGIMRQVRKTKEKRITKKRG